MAKTEQSAKVTQAEIIEPPKAQPVQPDRKELNKAKKADKKARARAQEAARKAKNAAKKEAKRRDEIAFKQTIVGNQIVDENGVPIRHYSFAERLLDNKKVGYGIGFGFIVLCLVALLALRGGLF
jgi:hypothetical protein